MNTLLLSFFSLFFAIFLGPSRQEKCEGQTCFTKPFDLHETFAIVDNLKSSTDEFLKKSLLQAAKETLGKMEGLPKHVQEKMKDDRFLMEKIDKVIEINKEKEKEKQESKEVAAVVDIKEQPATAKIVSNSVHIDSWEDLYHYFPHLGTKIRLWKMEFKESALANAKKFKGCANPAHLVNWLVPDIEDIKKRNKKTKRN